MHRRVRPRDLGLVGQPARTPAGLLTQPADPLLLLSRHPAGGAMRAAGALGQARQRRSTRRRGRAPAPDPLPHRRLRDVRPGGRLGERLTLFDDTTHNRVATPRGETGSMVRHPGLLEGVSFDTHTLSAGPDLTPHRVRNVPGLIT